MPLNYVRKINEKYIDAFANNVRIGLGSILRVSDSSYLKVIMSEVNKLFRIISGRMTAQRQIPKPNEFPDVKKYNTFLDNIGIDIDKIYAAQNYVEQDLQNVLNFNSLEREKAINTLARVQSNVYSAYVKAGTSIRGNTIIRESFKTDTLPHGSQNVSINMEKDTLMLATLNADVDKISIDKELINVLFSDRPSETYKLFPNNTSLALGSHWQRKYPAESHFTAKENPRFYREGFIDGPVAQNAGSVQFEAVATFDYTEDGSGPIRKKIEDKISKAFNKHHSTIMVDTVNSAQGRYVTDLKDIELNPKVKVIVPFTKAALSSALLFDIQPNDSEELPTIIFNESYIYDEFNARSNFIPLSKSKLEEYSKTGRFMLSFERGLLVPTRAEITLEYIHNAWTEINYYMVLYNYTVYKSLTLEAFDASGNIEASFIKTAYIFVDAESDLKNEKIRATNVMRSSEVLK